MPAWVTYTMIGTRFATDSLRQLGKSRLIGTGRDCPERPEETNRLSPLLRIKQYFSLLLAKRPEEFLDIFGVKLGNFPRGKMAA